jgi:hypothetical protein
LQTTFQILSFFLSVVESSLDKIELSNGSDMRGEGVREDEGEAMVAVLDEAVAESGVVGLSKGEEKESGVKGAG